MVGLSEGLADLPPGAELGMALASVDRECLSGFDRVVLIEARARQVAHDQAEFYADMVSVAEATAEELGPDFGPEEIADSAASEIRAGLGWTRRAAEYQLSFATDLVERLPQVWVALNAGWIDLPKARVIINQTRHLDQDTARTVADQVLERASGQTTCQLRARIQRLCISVDPESARKRYMRRASRVVR